MALNYQNDEVVESDLEWMLAFVRHAVTPTPASTTRDRHRNRASV